MLAAVLAVAAVACSPAGGSRALPELPPLPERLPERAADRGEEAPFREAIVALTGAVRGEVEVCGCPTTPYGGFARRSALYAKLRTLDVPFVAVDAGEMLVKGLTARDEVDRRVRAQAVLDLAHTAGLDAWAASPVDLLPGGMEFLRSAGALAANWSAPPASFGAASIVERAGVRLGFIGLAGTASDVKGSDAVAAVAAAKVGEADAWFVLSSADEATNRAVAEQVSGIAAVLATEGDRLDEPRTTNGAPIIEAPGRGRYVTLVHVFLASTPRALEVVERGIWKDVATYRSGRSLAGGGPSPAMDAEAKRDHERLVKRSRGRNYAFVETVPLGSDLDGDVGTEDTLDKFHAAILGSAQAAVAAPARGGYATGSACGGCHQDRLASWAFDGHARAIESLAGRDAASNPECIGCHSTGFGRPGGFADLTERGAAAYRDVQCEACHGPMRGHDGRGSVHSQPITEATCRACHDEANSPEFEYRTYLAKISCTRVATQRTPDAP
ncbi:hypothetical protein LBMAG42_37720 [Deltaproteobacteria bacterium]|nr:hypothetical protein LBMAG42_37720 [Deltaproteobacteria bacterium]